MQPDMLVVTAGFNDLLAALGGRDYLHYRQTERMSGARILAWLATETQLGRRLWLLQHRLKRIGLARLQEVPLETDAMRNAALSRRVPETTTIP